MSKRMKKSWIEKIFDDLGIKQNSGNSSTRYTNLKNHYFGQLYGIAIGSVAWDGFPSEIDTTILERMLVNDGSCVLYFDEIVEEYILLRLGNIKKYNAYGRPLIFDGITMYGNIRYKNLEDGKNCVVIYNNTNYVSSIPVIDHFSSELADLRLTKASNLYQMRKPIIVETSKESELTAKAILQKYDDFETSIVVKDGFLEEHGINVLDLHVQNHLSDLRNEFDATWNEALTNLGIPNIQGTKKERMIVDEANRMIAGAVACQQIELKPRLDATKKIKDVFDLEIQVDFVQGFNQNYNRKEVEEDGDIYDRIENDM